MRPVLAFTVAAAAALVLAACGTEGSPCPRTTPTYAGAVLFAERCSGCHTLTPAGLRAPPTGVRAQGPNLDERDESFDDVLFAIRNGGFSGAIMPQNIVTGEEARVAQFVAEYAGLEAQAPQPPGAGPSRRALRN